MERRALFAALLALAAHDAAAINKCVDKAGKTSYQEAECPSDSKDALKMPGSGNSAAPVPADPAPASTSTSTAEPPASAQVLELASTQATFEACTVAAPESAAEFAADYSAWRTRNATLLAKAERSPAFQAALASGRDQMREQSSFAPGNREQFARFCADQFIPVVRNANAGR